MLVAMELIQVDVIGGQTPQRCLARLPNVGRRCINAGGLTGALIKCVGKLGGDDDLFAAAGNARPTTRSLWPAP